MPNSLDTKLIVVHLYTKKLLDENKEFPLETYDSVIRRALRASKNQ